MESLISCRFGIIFHLHSRIFFFFLGGHCKIILANKADSPLWGRLGFGASLMQGVAMVSLAKPYMHFYQFMTFPPNSML